MILTEITTIFHCYAVMATQLNTFVRLYCCDNNITLKMAARATVTC